jgi:uncharacterized protein YdaU (DUF1376 family)
MAKGDYYFPLYYQKILSSTQGWKDDEFGAYMRLLIYQYDKGSIPNDMNIISRIAPTAKKNWALLSKKFEVSEAGELFNPVMKEIRERRLKKLEVNKENGGRGGRPITERLPKHNQTVTKNETNNNMVNGSCISDLEVRGRGEETFLVPQMLQVFKTVFPKYPAETMKDFPSLREISVKIKEYYRTETDEQILIHWGELSGHIKTDSHLSKYSLSQVNKHFQSVIQGLTNATHKQPIGKGKPSKSEGANNLLGTLVPPK